MGKNRCGIDKRQLSPGAERVITYASVWVSQSQTKLRHNSFALRHISNVAFEIPPCSLRFVFLLFFSHFQILKGEIVIESWEDYSLFLYMVPSRNTYSL